MSILGFRVTSRLVFYGKSRFYLVFLILYRPTKTKGNALNLAHKKTEKGITTFLGKLKCHISKLADHATFGFLCDHDNRYL